jgi:hypothetical protein
LVARVNLGILELDLEKMAELVSEMVSINLDPDTKDLVRKLVNEMTDAYDKMVDSYVSFEEIWKDDEKFRNGFSTLFVQFKKTYLKSDDDKRSICGRINGALYDIIHSRWYLSKLPRLSEKIKNFRNKRGVVRGRHANS